VRGPTNSIVLGEVSSLAAVAEATRAIQRDQVDVMIAGGAGSRINPMIWPHDQTRQYSQRVDDPSGASRPFDAGRDGLVNGDGAGGFILETRQGAEARGAKILAHVRGFAEAFEPRDGRPLQGTAIRRAIRQALAVAGLEPSDIGHVNAHGMSTADDDQLEAQAIRDTLGDVPVMAPKSYFGHLGAGSGAVEMAATVLAFAHRCVPPTLNYHTPDPLCPVNVIHSQPMPVTRPTAVVLNHSPSGQAMAVVLEGN
jgi:3-oxoacyl-[acyl-carrier-protein] synthase II